MTDLSKIDFTELKLEPIDNYTVTVMVPYINVLTLCLNTRTIATKPGDTWRLTKEVDAFDRIRTDELWKRTEQVDEFINKQSRRRITVAQMLVEIIESGREMTVLNNGLPNSYRFNGQEGTIEYLSTLTCWVPSCGAGNRDTIVTVID